MLIDLDAVRAAAGRIRGDVRSTPLMAAALLDPDPVPVGRLLLKLESLQVTGSFKARGAMSRLRSLPPDAVARGIVAASGGNHGVAVAYAAHRAGVPATVFVPEGVSPLKTLKIRRWGADLRVVGSVWDDTNAAALAFADEHQAAYFHPFADPAVVAGQGTTALEALAAVPEIDTFVVAIGGGGLISGISVVAKALHPRVRIVGVEPTGAPTLHASLAAGSVVTLPEVTTTVPTMAARRTDAAVFEIVKALVDDIVLVDDADMRRAADLLWLEMGLAADLSGAAAIAALMSGQIQVAESETVCALVCGAGSDALS